LLVLAAALTDGQSGENVDDVENAIGDLML